MRYHRTLPAVFAWVRHAEGDTIAEYAYGLDTSAAAGFSRCRSCPRFLGDPVWRTSEGIRTLKAGEAALVRAAVNDIWRELEQAQDNSDPWEWGVPLFDNLEWSEKVVLLANVASALLREDSGSQRHVIGLEGDSGGFQIECHCKFAVVQSQTSCGNTTAVS